MMETFGLETWRAVLENAMSVLIARIAAFLPKLAGAVLILLAGWIIARIVRTLVGRVLHRVGLDRATERLQVADPLRHAGMTQAPSAIAAHLVYWILMLTILLVAVETLGLSAVTTTIDRLIAYLPNVLAAGFIVIIGLLVARVGRDVVTSGAAAARIAEAERVGAAIHVVIVLVVAVLAIEQLGVHTELLVTVISVMLGAVALSMGVAFALGARQLVAHVLAGHYLRRNLPVGHSVAVRGRRGEVERVGAVDTMLRADKERWSIPNSTLLEEVVDHGPSPNRSAAV